MEVSDERSQLFATLEESLRRDSDIEFVVAFGSRITGEPTDASDLDLAVKFAAGLSDRERFETRCFLSGDLQRDAAPFVDLSEDLEGVPLLGLEPGQDPEGVEAVVNPDRLGEPPLLGPTVERDLHGPSSCVRVRGVD
jgi:predicted nucleotidyltransferase